MIKKITVKTSATDTGTTYMVGQMDPSAADCIYRKDDTEGSGLKDGNLEIKSPAGSKLNLVADHESIQIKPGLDEDTAINPLQLDCEAGTVECNEFPIKVCNGLKNKQIRVVGTKLNTAELVLDTQKADTGSFDPKAFKVRFRNDKWNGGESAADGTGPIYAKLEARAFDVRCHDHGGIALQIAGHDGDSHENKIKFESDRTTAPGTTASYIGEGGKGLEFGTFNNEHTSLYTKDYRFKADAPVYAVTRGAVCMYDSDGEITEVATEAEKYDYPTQADDFKDIINTTKSATWDQIVTVAKAYADGEINGGGSSAGGDTDLTAYLKKSEASSTYATKTEVQGLASTTYVDTKTNNPALQYTSINDKGNVVFDITTVETNRAEYNAYVAAKSAWDIASANYSAYLAALETWNTYNALEDKSTWTEEIPTEPAVVENPGTEPTAVALEYADSMVKSLGKIKLKANSGVEFEGEHFGAAIEITGKGKVKYAEFDSGENTTYDAIIANFPKIQLEITNEAKSKNFTAEEYAKISGLQTVEVSLYDLIKLVDRVNSLETQLTGILTRLDNLEGGE